jgi:SAM-dependent methyltransferase
MSEPSWSGGYPVDRDYDYVFVPHMTPANLGVVATHHGIHAPSSSKFRYFELGAGFGLMSILMGASNPDAEIWANDFNPNHVLEARSLIEDAELSNVHFLEDSFQELLNRDLPEFDFIGLHGVYTWVSAENRRAIVEFVRRRLKVGGFVYVSYNSPAGFGPIAPLRQLMNSAAAVMGGSVERHVNQGFELINRLAAVDAAYVGLKQIAPSLEKVKKKKLGYLVGEFFTRDWNLFLHTDVAGEFSDAKVSYVGAARLLDDLMPLTYTPQQIELVKQIPDRGVQENVKDFIAGRNFRRDTFARGTRRVGSAQERMEALLATRFTLLQPRSTCSYTANVQDGELTLLEHVHGPLLDALARGPATLAELVKVPALEPLGWEGVVNAMLTLFAVGYTAPYFEPCAKAIASAARLNAAITRRATSPRPIPCLAAPAMGSGVVVSQANQLFVEATQAGADLAVFAWERMRRAGQSMKKDGQPIEGTEANLAALRELARVFVEQDGPQFKQLGVFD